MCGSRRQFEPAVSGFSSPTCNRSFRKLALGCPQVLIRAKTGRRGKGELGRRRKPLLHAVLTHALTYLLTSHSFLLALCWRGTCSRRAPRTRGAEAPRTAAVALE